MMQAVTQSQSAFREAMSRLGAAVNIITTDGVAGRAGFTATAVCSLSDRPPSMIVCMNRGSRQNIVFRGNGALCVNVLAENQRPMAEQFAGATALEGAQRFAVTEWLETPTGSPALAGALASIDARIVQIVETPTHDVMICNVTQVLLQGQQSALIYFDRSYHGLTMQRHHG